MDQAFFDMGWIWYFDDRNKQYKVWQILKVLCSTLSAKKKSALSDKFFLQVTKIWADENLRLTKIKDEN